MKIRGALSRVDHGVSESALPSSRDDERNAFILDETLSSPALALLGPDVLAARVALRLQRVMPNDLVNVTLLDSDGDLVVRGTLGSRTNRIRGLRIPLRSGLGGLVVSEGRAIAVTDYSRMGATREFTDLMVDKEGIRAAVGVPIILDGEALGLLFLGRRNHNPISNEELAQIEEVAAAVAPLLATSMQLTHSVQLAAIDERQRIATDLHDRLIPVLFAVSAATTAARAALASGDQGEAAEHIGGIESLASLANSLTRDIISKLGPLQPNQVLPAQLRQMIDRFMALSGVPVSFGVLGAPVALDAATVDTLTSVVVESLNNVAKHAPRASAVVTLTYGPHSTVVAVLDDGRTATAGLTIPSIAELGAGEHFGLANLNYRLSLLQGTLDIESNEDHGFTVRATVPLPDIGGR